MRYALVAALMVALLGAAGCSRGGAIGAARTARAPHPMNPSVMRVAVLDGVRAAGFTPEHESPGEVIALQLAADGQALRIRVGYDGTRYVLSHAPSYAGERPTQEVDRHIEALRVQIDARLAVAGSTAAPPPSYGEATPATAAMPAPGGMQPMQTQAAPLRRIARETRPLWEVAVPGIVAFVGSWVANWAGSLALGGLDNYVGLSFLPLAGPWAQLPMLEWSRVPRWTGIFHPAMGFTQIAGFAVMIVGLAVQVPVDGGNSQSDLRFEMMPLDGGVLGGLSGRY